MNEATTATQTRIYFASDVHLGVPNLAESQQRERRFVRWLNHIEQDATALYIMGDLFDFWFEYKTVVPRGYVRVLGKLAQMRDDGLPIYFFTGNHDLWMFGYFEEELDIPVYKKYQVLDLSGKTFLIGHGDGLGPKDRKYKLVKKYLFTNPITQFLLAILHPNIAIGIANYFSRSSRKAHGEKDAHFLGEDQEWLVQYAKRKLEQQHIDYFVFGHRHLPLDIQLNKNSKYINLGDWIKYYSYAIFDGQEIKLQYFEATN